VALKGSSREDLPKVCHEMSGALGFYELEVEMHLITDLQTWVESHLDASSEEVNRKKKEIVTTLEEVFSALGDAMETNS
jgi:hypothetical protein